MTRVLIVGDKIAEKFGQQLRSIGERDAQRVLVRGLNRGGNEARTQIKRSLVSQMGIKYGLVNQAVTTIPATKGRLQYSLEARGGETNLNLFGAAQRKKGVSSAPWKTRRIFRGTFIVPAYAGRVFKREGKERGPLDPLFGPNIARELTRSPTIDKWGEVQGYILKNVTHDLHRLFSKR